MTTITDAQAVALTAAAEGALISEERPEGRVFADTRDGLTYAARTIQSLLRRGYLHAERVAGSRGTRRQLIATTLGREALGADPIETATTRRLVGIGKAVPTPSGTRAAYLEFNRAGLGQPTTPSATTTAEAARSAFREAYPRLAELADRRTGGAR